MSHEGQFSIKPIRRYSDEPMVIDEKTRLRARALIEQGYVPDRSLTGVRRAKG